MEAVVAEDATIIMATIRDIEEDQDLEIWDFVKVRQPTKAF